MSIRVEVVYALAGEQAIVPLQMEEGACVADALAASGLFERYRELDREASKAGIWGRVVPRTQLLRDGDRVELYRPLKADPKQARRARAQGRRGGN